MSKEDVKDALDSTGYTTWNGLIKEISSQYTFDVGFRGDDNKWRTLLDQGPDTNARNIMLATCAMINNYKVQLLTWNDSGQIFHVSISK